MSNNEIPQKAYSFVPDSFWKWLSKLPKEDRIREGDIMERNVARIYRFLSRK